MYVNVLKSIDFISMQLQKSMIRFWRHIVLNFNCNIVTAISYHSMIWKFQISKHPHPIVHNLRKCILRSPHFTKFIIDMRLVFQWLLPKCRIVEICSRGIAFVLGNVNQKSVSVLHPSSPDVFHSRHPSSSDRHIWFFSDQQNC